MQNAETTTKVKETQATRPSCSTVKRHSPAEQDLPPTAGVPASLPLSNTTTDDLELRWTVWPAARPDQTHVAWDGHTEEGAWRRLCRWVEREHAGPVYAKGRGPQWAPVGNLDGHRCIESTSAVYGLTLDCDGRVGRTRGLQPAIELP
jgi:hypothetical protein